MFLQFSQKLSPNTVKNRLNASKSTLYQQNDVSSWLSCRKRQFAILLLIQESQVRSSCGNELVCCALATAQWTQFSLDVHPNSNTSLCRQSEWKFPERALSSCYMLFFLLFCWITDTTKCTPPLLKKAGAIRKQGYQLLESTIIWRVLGWVAEGKKPCGKVRVRTVTLMWVSMKM